MITIFKKKVKEEEPKDLKEAIEIIKELQEKVEKFSEELDSLKKENKLAIKRVGVIRFNPFNDVGGDQSFCIALLNGRNTGVVITSLYTRDENRVYGKPVRNGSSEYSLSNEEKEAIEKAKKDKDDGEGKESIQ